MDMKKMSGPELRELLNNVKATEAFTPTAIELLKLNDEEFGKRIDALTKDSSFNPISQALLSFSFKLYSDIYKFQKRYIEYVLRNVEKDPTYYITNSALNYLLRKEINQGNFDNQVNGEKIADIYDKLRDVYNDIINKESLTEEEHNFIRKYYIFMALSGIIAKKRGNKKDLMYDIVRYFDKYPINNIDTNEDKQLFMLYEFSKEVLPLNTNMALTFYESPLIVDDKKILGSIGEIDYYDYRVSVYDVNNGLMKNLEMFFDAMFTIYHELGHLQQRINVDDISPTERQIIKEENYIVEHDNDFYIKNIDYFYTEFDADYRAFKMIEKFPENIKQLAICYFSKIMSKSNYKKDPNAMVMIHNRYLALKRKVEKEEKENRRAKRKEEKENKRAKRKEEKENKRIKRKEQKRKDKH